MRQSHAYGAINIPRIAEFNLHAFFSKAVATQTVKKGAA